MSVSKLAILKPIIISLLFISLFHPLSATVRKNIVCYQGKCYIRVNYSCSSKLPVKCEPHTRCIRGRCRHIARVGQACRRPGPHYRECDTNLVCIGHVCRIREKKTCTRHPKLCRPETLCVGPRQRKQCRKPMGPGKRCQVDPYWFCQKKLLCQHRICRVGNGGSCLSGGKALPCAKGLICVGGKTKKFCRRLTGPGGKCRGTGQSTCQQGLKCESRICKVPQSKSCLRNGKSVPCVSGTVCVGRSNHKVCKKPMGPGGRCQVDPFWVCLRGLTCQKRVCKIPEKSDCSRARNHCISGTKCVGTSRRKQCRRPNGPGGQCRPSSFGFCGMGLACQQHVCRIRNNQACNRNPKLCVSGLKCVGPSKKKRCRRPQGFRQTCRPNSYHICADGLTCDNGICRKSINAKCLSQTNGCVKAAVCVGPRNNLRCQKPINVGDRCNPKNLFLACSKGLVCDGNICRIREGQSCIRNTNRCQQGTKCVGTSRRKLCKKPMKVGGRCAVDPSWFCDKGLICQEKVCRLRENAVCTSNLKLCAKGLHCVGPSRRKECRRPIPVGGQCRRNNSYNRCINGSSCDNSRCRLGLNGPCKRTPAFCARNLHCVGNGKNKRCRKPVEVGKKCNKDPKWTCRKGLVCEKHICKLQEGTECNNRLNKYCKSSTKCVGRPGQRRCRKQVQLNGVCNDNQNLCIGSLACDAVGNPRRCKLPPNANCRKAPNSCVSGTRCVNGKCQRPLQAGGNCNNRNGGLCGVNLICQSNICRIPVNQTCSQNTQNFCASGLACIVDPKSKARSCKPAGTLLTKCDMDRELGMQCQDGLMCDLEDDRCKIPADEECTANQTACLSGTKCVGDAHLKVCTTPMEAGEPCAVDPFWVCGEGLKCQGHVCRVDRGGSCFIPFHECLLGLSCGAGYKCS